MENLSEDGTKSAWMLFRLAWYVNIILFVLVMLVAAYYMTLVLEVKADDGATRTTMMIGMLVIACVLLMGAGISRYEAMSLSQHAEIKAAVDDLRKELVDVKKKQA